MKICDPTGVTGKKRDDHAPLVMGGLAGKTVGILSNLWPSYEGMIVRFREQLLDQHRVSRVNYYEIPRTRAASDELLRRVASECDAAIVGLGN
jgi:hypothetical protein